MIGRPRSLERAHRASNATALTLLWLGVATPALAVEPTLTGVKSDISYSVRAKTPKHLPQATEVVIDLAEVLTKPDPEFGLNKPLTLDAPTVTVWFPGESAPRETHKLWPGTQAGQFRARFSFAGNGYGTLRVDGVRSDGRPLAVMLPMAVGQPKEKQLPVRMFAPTKGDALDGSVAMGRQIYNQRCAGCHGKDLYGAAKNEDDMGRGAPKLYSAEVMLSMNERDLFKRVLLDTLDTADVVAFLLPYRPNLAKLHDVSSRYVYRGYDLDDEDATELRRLAGQEVKSTRIGLLAFYQPLPDAPATGSPQRIAEPGRDLDSATKKTRTGYVAIVSGVDLAPTRELWLFLDNQLVIQGLATRDDASRPTNKPSKDALAAFIGSGDRVEESLPKLDRVQKGDALAAAVAGAFGAARMAIKRYEREEADRDWAAE